MVSVVSVQVISVTKTPKSPHDDDEYDNDGEVQSLPLDVEVSGGNGDLKTVADSHVGTTMDSLAAQLAANNIEDDVDGEQFTENGSKHVERPASCTGPGRQDGCSETDGPTPKCTQYSAADQPNVVSLVLANDDDDVTGCRVQLKSTNNSEERRENDDVETGHKNQSEDIEDSLVTGITAVTLRDEATTETTKRDLLGRSPTNGVSTSSPDGNQSAKYRRCSPQEADRASETSATGGAEPQFFSASQPLETVQCLRYPEWKSTALSPNAAQPNMANRYLPTQQSIPGPLMRSDCCFMGMPEPSFLPSYVSDQNQFPTRHRVENIAQWPILPSNCFEFASNSRPSFPCPSVAATLSPPMEPPLPELSPDDVEDLLKASVDHSVRQRQQVRQQNGDGVCGFATMEPVPVPYHQPVHSIYRRPDETVGQRQSFIFEWPNVAPTAAPGRMGLTTPANAVQQQFVSNSVPSLSVFQQQMASSPCHKQVVDGSPASSWTHSLSSPISPSISDTSQHVCDDDASVVAASSCGDSSDMTYLINAGLPVLGSNDGSPAVTNDGEGSVREPSPRDNDAFLISPIPPEQLVSSEFEL